MPKTADDLSALFRSLSPDDSSFQANAALAAREATQRWPLFQALAPHKQETTPTLSAQERQRWSQQEEHVGGDRKPALSLPGLRDKMAKSLGKMAGRAADTPARSPAKRTEPQRPPVTLPEDTHSTRPRTNASPRNSLFPGSLKADQDRETLGAGLGLFGSRMGGQTLSQPAESRATGTDDSLASVFSRLEDKQEPVHRPVAKKSSFLSRLGKR